MNQPGPLLLGAEFRRARVSARLDPARRASLGQFLTPSDVAGFMAALFDVPPGPVRLLDPGAGVGSLSAAVAERWGEYGAGPLHITAVEIDAGLGEALAATLDDAKAKVPQTSCEITLADFIEWGVDRCTGFSAASADPFDLVVMNPPYRKVGAGSAERRMLKALGVDVPNLYAAFLAIAIRLLKPGGQVVAITPRSFANGPYFRSFRRDLLDQVSIRRIHIYDERDSAFGDGEVLQENVIVHAVRGRDRGVVTVSTSTGADDQFLLTRDVKYTEVVGPTDPDSVIHLTVDAIGAGIAERMWSLQGRLSDLPCSVSTGRVVDFRTRENLRQGFGEGSAPLLYPSHLTANGIRWPVTKGRKPNALAINASTERLMLPSGYYVLVKRFSSKEERRRIVATLCTPNDLPGSFFAFENHLNVLHWKNEGLPETLGRGLACYLNSTIVDQFFRQFNGHTQVNASDLRRLPYPSLQQLAALGEAAIESPLSQDKHDALVANHVPEVHERGGARTLETHRRVVEAQVVLRSLGLPKAQTNERSALTLLALLDLTPDRLWTEAGQPLMGITPMMTFMAQHYGKDYAPNTREVVRRQTVHQFVLAGLCRANPDDPTRPTNSGDFAYQMTDEVVSLLRCYGTDEWTARLDDYRSIAQALADRWAAERDMHLLPVTLPDESMIELSPGGQNPLIKAIIEDFCARFVPGGQVLYIGDSARKWVINEADALADLGVVVDEHGKMPDVVIYRPDKGWLVLIEAATTHGPVDPKRREELASLFAETNLRLVYVTALLDRAALRRYVADVAWETEVWVADSPSHLIHFDGERFLTPDE